MIKFINKKIHFKFKIALVIIIAFVAGYYIYKNRPSADTTYKKFYADFMFDVDNYWRQELYDNYFLEVSVSDPGGKIKSGKTTSLNEFLVTYNDTITTFRDPVLIENYRPNDKITVILVRNASTNNAFDFRFTDIKPGVTNWTVSADSLYSLNNTPKYSIKIISGTTLNSLSNGKNSFILVSTAHIINASSSNSTEGWIVAGALEESTIAGYIGAQFKLRSLDSSYTLSALKDTFESTTKDDVVKKIGTGSQFALSTVNIMRVNAISEKIRKGVRYELSIDIDGTNQRRRELGRGEVECATICSPVEINLNSDLVGDVFFLKDKGSVAQKSFITGSVKNTSGNYISGASISITNAIPGGPPPSNSQTLSIGERITCSSGIACGNYAFHGIVPFEKGFWNISANSAQGALLKISNNSFPACSSTVSVPICIQNSTRYQINILNGEEILTGLDFVI